MLVYAHCMECTADAACKVLAWYVTWCVTAMPHTLSLRPRNSNSLLVPAESTLCVLRSALSCERRECRYDGMRRCTASCWLQPPAAAPAPAATEGACKASLRVRGAVELRAAGSVSDDVCRSLREISGELFPVAVAVAALAPAAAAAELRPPARLLAASTPGKTRLPDALCRGAEGSTCVTLILVRPWEVSGSIPPELTRSLFFPNDVLASTKSLHCCRTALDSACVAGNATGLDTKGGDIGSLLVACRSNPLASGGCGCTCCC